MIHFDIKRHIKSATPIINFFIFLRFLTKLYAKKAQVLAQQHSILYIIYNKKEVFQRTSLSGCYIIPIQK